MVLKEMVDELPGLYELPSKEVLSVKADGRMGGWEGRFADGEKKLGSFHLMT